jgi:hypothetical protein
MLPQVRLVLACCVLGGCGAPETYRPPDENRLAIVTTRSATPVRLPEPESSELVVVVNNNAFGGSHAGLFIGARLSDPSGNYASDRSRDPAWRGPSLADYVDYQMHDGDKVLVYRFRLDPAAFATVDARVRDWGGTAPLFCAAAVQNQIAGVGPLAGVGTVGWTSPSALAQLLDGLTIGGTALGSCLRPDGARC